MVHVSLEGLDNVLGRVCQALCPEGLLFASCKCSELDWRDAEGRFDSAINPLGLRHFACRAGFEVSLVEEVQGHGCLRDPTTWAWLIATRKNMG